LCGQPNGAVGGPLIKGVILQANILKVWNKNSPGLFLLIQVNNKNIGAEDPSEPSTSAPADLSFEEVDHL
jgi:hypothetical protein